MPRNININKYLDYARDLAIEKFGRKVYGVAPLGVETSNFAPEYVRLEFKVFLKDYEELYLNIFLKGNKITGYDFVVKE